MRRKLKNSLLLFLISPVIWAQDVLTPDAFMKIIGENHPVAKQADLRIGQSAAEVLSSKGIFDPVFAYDRDEKRLSGDQYYRYDQPELSLFTPLGIKVKTGIESSGGEYLNPQRTPGVLSYAGVELPVLRGLLLDKKRATLQKARIYQQSADVEKRSMINDLYVQALGTYWDWAAAFKQLTVLEQNLENARKRLELTKVLFENGDKALADTVEAAGQVIALELDITSVRQEFLKKGVGLSEFLWDTDGEAYLPAPTVRPDTLFFNRPPELFNTGELISQLNLHPDLMIYDFKLKGLEVEQRLKRQDILPELNLKANLLSKDYYSFEGAYNPYLTNNYKFGISFNMPLFLREGRGQYQKASLKIDETQWALRLKRQQLETKIRQYDTELRALQQQIGLSQNLVANYQRLLDLEELRFSQGESSLFVINSRQNKLLDSYTKLIQLQAKYLQSWFKQQWVAGLLIS
ncbi:TolC family protein [Jiulongibacter sediminis]|uniref:TolC family protein n=1 Tax=Jiulongibacter sediminis TaxID=1605367 RepID=UPI0026EADB62|nr:TolC family protein [Jiulongibacter sediminis]